jgi:hypothetical protein
VKFSDLIYVKDNVLSENFCEHLIDKFERDDRKKAGVIMGMDVEKEYKNTTDLHLSSMSDWKEEDIILFESSSKLLLEYDSYCKKIFPDLFFYSANWKYCDNGYQIQRYDETQEYKWHQDYHIDHLGGRMVTTIWYLNTVNSGGTTEFIDGTKIQAKIGRCVLFPATWNYVHRGTKPISGKKYIVISLLCGIPNY